MPASDPITGIANAATAVVTMISGVLPTEEERLNYFKLHFPIRYARIRKRLLVNAFHYLKHHNGVDVDTYINFVNGDLSVEDRASVAEILKAELKGE